MLKTILSFNVYVLLLLSLVKKSHKISYISPQKNTSLCGILKIIAKFALLKQQKRIFKLAKAVAETA